MRLNQGNANMPPGLYCRESLILNIKVNLNVDFSEALGHTALPYERLIGDALHGDPTLFATERAVEGTWGVIDKILGPVGRAHRYDCGSMGPKAADALTRGFGGWVQPADPQQPKRGSPAKR